MQSALTRYESMCILPVRAPAKHRRRSRRGCAQSKRSQAEADTFLLNDIAYTLTYGALDPQQVELVALPLFERLFRQWEVRAFTSSDMPVGDALTAMQARLEALRNATATSVLGPGQPVDVSQVRSPSA